MLTNWKRNFIQSANSVKIGQCECAKQNKHKPKYYKHEIYDSRNDSKHWSWTTTAANLLAHFSLPGL